MKGKDWQEAAERHRKLGGCPQRIQVPRITSRGHDSSALGQGWENGTVNRTPCDPKAGVPRLRSKKHQVRRYRKHWVSHGFAGWVIYTGSPPSFLFRNKIWDSPKRKGPTWTWHTGKDLWMHRERPFSKINRRQCRWTIGNSSANPTPHGQFMTVKPKTFSWLSFLNIEIPFQ